MQYKGHEFTKVRNLSGAEAAQENILRRKGQQFNIAGFRYTDFYRVAEMSGLVADIYLLDGEHIVIAIGDGIYEYDQTKSINREPTYYSHCCGKYVAKRKSQYYCSRCHRRISKSGKTHLEKE